MIHENVYIIYKKYWIRLRATLILFAPECWNMAQSTFRKRGFKIVKIKDHAFIQVDLNRNDWIFFVRIFLKYSSQEPFKFKVKIISTCSYHIYTYIILVGTVLGFYKPSLHGLERVSCPNPVNTGMSWELFYSFYKFSLIGYTY